MKSDAPSSKESNIKVLARVRPVASTKPGSEHRPFQIQQGKAITIAHPKKLHFELDLVFNETVQQEQVFELVGRGIVEDALKGYNGTLFAYGQTGSGKTFSLFGDCSNPDSPLRGIIPRACQLLFHSVENDANVSECTVKVSILEIYREKVQDLLSPGGKKLKLRERPDSSIFVENLYEEYASSFSDVYSLIDVGFRNRAVSSTLMNKESSRSHCVLTLYIRQTLADGSVKTSKLNFADLAGSERVSKTGASGQTLDEAKTINQSLSALGNCINALTSQGRSHVPYRDSSLTFLLKDSLGGNTKTVLLVTCHSDAWNIEESISTLRFATRAKRIKTKARVNRVLSVKELEFMLSVCKRKLGVANSTIHRLAELIQLMRTPGFDAEVYGSKIDEYLLYLNSKSDADESGLDAEHEAVIAKANSMSEEMRLVTQDKSEVSEKEETPEEVRIVEQLRCELDEKDELIEKLSVEVRQHREQEFRLRESIPSVEEDSTQSQETVEITDSEWKSKYEEQMGKIQELTAQKTELEENNRRLLEWNGQLTQQFEKVESEWSESTAHQLSDSATMQRHMNALRQAFDDAPDDSVSEGSSSVIDPASVAKSKPNEDSSVKSKQIAKLKKENQRLMHKLSEMRQTWVAHLDMLLHSDNPSDLRALAINSAQSADVPIPQRKTGKFVKPVSHHNHRSSKSRGFRGIIDSLSSALQSYFGQPAVFRGWLELCTVPVSFVDFEYNKEEWTRCWFLLTRDKLVGFPSELHADSSTGTPVMSINVESMVSVLRLEDVLRSMEVDSTSAMFEQTEQDTIMDNVRDGIFIITTASSRTYLKSEGTLSREMWIERVQQLISGM